jgi:hypothetical protein
MREECIQDFDRQPLKKRPLGRRICSLEDNIKMDLRDLTGYIWLRIGTSEYGKEPSLFMK